MTERTAQSPPIVTVTKGESDGGGTSRSRVRITSPTGIIQVVPYLLGFQPGRDMIIIGTWPPRSAARITMRYPLPYKADAKEAAASARHAILILSAQQYPTAVVVGYGLDEAVRPFVDRLRDEAEAYEIGLTEILRVDAQNQRYWSYLCTNPECCPPEGRPYDPSADPALTKLFAEAAPVLASREVLAATIAPCGGEDALSMTRATRKAERRAARLLSKTPRPGASSGKRTLAVAGIEAVQKAIEQYRQGETLTHDEAAWLMVVLRDQWVRDDAWSRMDPEHRKAHLRLWTELTRLALRRYLPAPASLLAFVAWQGGNGALANIALDRAQAVDPNYSMARLLRDALDAGMRPEHAELPMTPGEVAEWYGGCYGAGG